MPRAVWFADVPAADDGRMDERMDEILICASCGKPLGFDPDDDPAGDAGQPICGECDRARNFDAELEVLDALDEMDE
jgi:hypothetical protein